MEHNFGMYLTGAEAVNAAQAFTDGHCYRSLYADGVKLAQVEIVLDDVVEVSYIASMENVEKAIKALAENGFSGVPYEVYTETVEGCYAQQASTGRVGIIGDTTDTTTAQTESKEEEKKMIKVSEIERPVLTSNADALCDYERGYICDIITEIANKRTSIYYSDIIKFISEHVEKVNDAIEEFGWDGCGSDLYKAGQMAEFSMIESEIYDELEDGLTVRAIDYIEHDMKVEQITEEQLDEIRDLCADTDNNDRIDDFLDQVESIVNGDSEENNDNE